MIYVLENKQLFTFLKLFVNNSATLFSRKS